MAEQPHTDPLAALPRKDEPKAQETTPEEKASLLSNMLAIAGLIILVVIIIWGLVHLAGLSKSFFSSLFPHYAPSISVTAPASVTSREAFTVSWKYAPSESGTYAVLYQCNDSLRFETPSASGDMQSIPCGATFLLGTSEADALSLTPSLSSDASVSVPFSVLYLPSATSSEQAQGSATIAVMPGTAPTTTTEPATTVSAPKPRLTGPADLSVRVVSLTMAGTTGIAVFDISNIGSGYSGSYTFTATLPTSGYGPTYYGAPQQQSYTYNSPAQSSLGPGDHIVNTLRFTQAQTGGVFSVTIDPSSSVNDSNRTNNYAYQTLGGNYYPPQPYYAY